MEVNDLKRRARDKREAGVWKKGKKNEEQKREEKNGKVLKG
jgi:hypothetical protein